MTVNEPNQSLYVHHLNEKLSKSELKRSLYFLFSQYGQVLEIVALKTIKSRGQAFIVYKDLEAAKTAIKALDGLLFYDKPMAIEYAKTKSKAALIDDGRYMPFIHKEHENLLKRTRTDEDEDDEDETEEVEKKPAPKKIAKEQETKTRVLLIKNLPPGTSEDNVRDLVGQFSGFDQIRPVPERNDLFYVEFPSEAAAATVKKSLHGLRIAKSSNVLQCEYSQ